MYYLSLVKLNRLRFKYGMKVRLNSCGKGLCIVHLGSIITNGDVGEDARLFVNSAIVSNGGGEREPRLGNHVTLFTNAVVCGDVKIGNNCCRFLSLSLIRFAPMSQICQVLCHWHFCTIRQIS